MNETNEADLAACPFCNHEAYIYYRKTKAVDGVQCGNCGALIDGNNCIAAWNTRHQAPAAEPSVKESLIDDGWEFPPEVIRAARTLERHFNYNFIHRDWEFLGIASRSSLDKAKAEIAALKTALKLSESTESDWITKLKEQAIESGDKLKVAIVEIAALKNQSLTYNLSLEHVQKTEAKNAALKEVIRVYHQAMVMIKRDLDTHEILANKYEFQKTTWIEAIDRIEKANQSLAKMEE